MDQPSPDRRDSEDLAIALSEMRAHRAAARCVSTGLIHRGRDATDGLGITARATDGVGGRSITNPDIVVIDKDNGGRADAKNAGINAARHRKAAVACGMLVSPGAVWLEEASGWRGVGKPG